MDEQRKSAPGGRRSAAERIRAEGRPTRVRDLVEVSGGALSLEALSSDEQRGLLEPFVRDGEYIRFSNAGEAFIQAVDSGHGSVVVERSEHGEKSIPQLQREAAVRRKFDKAVERATRAAFQQGYVEATASLAPMVVELEEKVLKRALGPDATDADRRIAMQAVRDMKDRWMGKATQSVEVSHEGKSVVQELAKRGGFEFEDSSEWTVEGVVAAERAKGDSDGD